MAFYKKVKQKGDDKWHPRAVTKGHPYTTDEIARLLSEMSTVTPGDTYASINEPRRSAGQADELGDTP